MSNISVHYIELFMAKSQLGQRMLQFIFQVCLSRDLVHVWISRIKVAEWLKALNYHLAQVQILADPKKALVPGQTLLARDSAVALYPWAALMRPTSTVIQMRGASYNTNKQTIWLPSYWLLKRFFSLPLNLWSWYEKCKSMELWLSKFERFSNQALKYSDYFKVLIPWGNQAHISQSFG